MKKTQPSFPADAEPSICPIKWNRKEEKEEDLVSSCIDTHFISSRVVSIPIICLLMHFNIAPPIVTKDGRHQIYISDDIINENKQQRNTQVHGLIYRQTWCWMFRIQVSMWCDSNGGEGWGLGIHSKIAEGYQELYFWGLFRTVIWGRSCGGDIVKELGLGAGTM